MGFFGPDKRRWLRQLVPQKVSSTIALLVLIVLVPLFALQAGVYTVWYRTRLREVKETDLELARAVATAFDAYIQDLYRQQHTLETALGAVPAPSPAVCNRLLEASEEQYDTVRAIHWVDAEGTVIASSDPNSVGTLVADSDFVGALGSGQDRVVSDLTTSWVTGRPIFMVGQRMEASRNGSAGALLTIVYPDALDRRALNIKVDPSDAFTLFDSSGTIVFSTVPHWLGLPWTLAGDPALKEALAGREASDQVAVPDSGERRLASRVPIPSLGWVAGSSVSEALLVAPVLRTALLGTTILCAVAVFSLAGALFISRRIIHPLNELRRQAHLIGAGRLDRRADVRGPVELEELAATFNTMSAQLAAARAELEQANADLVRSNRDLEQFAYIASHDLQEPLRAVAGFTTLLQQRYQGRLDERADGYIHFVVDGIARMHALINGLLEYSRVNTHGNVPAPVRADEALQEALANLRAALQESSADVTSAPLPTVCADATQLTHVFQNLIENAIKFRAERRPEIQIGSRPHEKGWRLFWVRDNGIGIDPQYAERVFMIFQRLHTRNKYPGTGIGLAVCKRIIERHGGKIWVESRPEQGATFYFTLPDEGVQS
jgi:signal transduction histidine kinase